MKLIKLKISEEAYGRLKTCMEVKKMSIRLYGIEDEIIMLIIKGIEKGQEEVSIGLKNEEEK